jgi:hypothetical protein
VIHPQWPILHIPTFFNNLESWSEPSFAALVVSMCMLASRYSQDPRVRADPGKLALANLDGASDHPELTKAVCYLDLTTANPVTAGYHYFVLFRRLRDLCATGDNVVFSIQSLFFASQFHCV